MNCSLWQREQIVLSIKENVSKNARFKIKGKKRKEKYIWRERRIYSHTDKCMYVCIRDV